MSYVDEVLEIVKKKNADQPEFLQAVTEVLDSLRPCIDANEELYRKNAILERITEPDRQIMFRVPWVDDNGQVQVNRGFRVQFNNSIGPYKGGLRLYLYYSIKAGQTQEKVRREEMPQRFRVDDEHRPLHVGADSISVLSRSAAVSPASSSAV